MAKEIDKLKKLRDKIDLIDDKLLNLIQSRADIASKIGELKATLDKKTSFYKPDRESKILKNILAKSEGPLADSKVRSIYKELISACLSIEETIKVGFLGPEGTYSDGAVIHHFGSSVKKFPYNTIEDVFYRVHSGDLDYGVIPVENSSEGVVNTSLNCLADFKELSICGETYIDIKHQLASGSRFDLKDAIAIASHPQALGQCSKWINQNLGSLKRISLNSSAEAAKYAKENDNVLCIVSEVAVKKYKLYLQQKDIHDFIDNKTRFLIIGSNEVNKTGDDKCSLLVQTENTAGALFKILESFKKRKINLSKIETRPSRVDGSAHDFFIDLDGHHKNTKVKSALNEIKDSGSFVRLLGSYPKYI